MSTEPEEGEHVSEQEKQTHDRKLFMLRQSNGIKKLMAGLHDTAVAEFEEPLKYEEVFNRKENNE